MRSREDYIRIVVVALVLSVGILAAFQVYLLREPARIADVLAADQSAQIASGGKLFTDNCATCHGKLGEGDMGPALNDRKFLKGTDDGVIFSLIGSGVPGTGMPSWSQTHGGPFTDEQIRDVVSFVRHWEATAPDIVKTSPTPDPAKGEAIFKATCYACHGVNGEGTDRAPALNSPALLAQFDDTWFRQTIAEGRPSKGMPTWGQVLSPAQINSIVAYIRSWQTVAVAVTPTTAPTTPTPAVQATAETSPTVEIARPSNGNLTPGPAINLVGNSTSGAKIFVDNCQKCHGDAGKGGVDNAGSTDGTVPPLNPIDDTLASPDLKVFATNIDLFIEHGSVPESDNPKLVMDAWGDKAKLAPQQIADVIAYVMGLNGATVMSTTPEPTAAATTETPAADIARPSNGNLTPGPGINLVGDSTSGAKIFVGNCQKCHGEQGKGGIDNAGSTDGTIPPLNPIDDTMVSQDLKVFATNIDLFIEHGSVPEGDSPKLVMDAWGDKAKLTPQQIADVIAYVMGLNGASGGSVTPAPTVAATETPAADIARPSNGNLTPGAAISQNLSGNNTAGEKVFVDNCQKCHGEQGKGGIDNAGSTDGTVPPLNPIDDTMVSQDLKVFATNIDLFIEHGSVPEGDNPKLVMDAWGDKAMLTPQQIADVITYVMGLNGAPTEGATPSPTVAIAETPAADIARPSNGNLTPGVAVSLVGDAKSGESIFVSNCQKCHGEQGKSGIDNAGSTDGTVPSLNPIDDTLVSQDLKLFATNVDLFIEHGSTPEGDNPKLVMDAWGDKAKLTPQQIADVIAYLIELNNQ